MLNTEEEGKVDAGENLGGYSAFIQVRHTAVELQKAIVTRKRDRVIVIAVYACKRRENFTGKGVVSHFRSQVRRVPESWVPRICKRTQEKEVLVTEWTRWLVPSILPCIFGPDANFDGGA